MKKTVVLTFKETTWDKPIVYKLIKDFDLVFNILKAEISPNKEGLLVLEITGSEEAFNDGINYLKRFDIAITSIEKEVTRIEKKCLHCGLCTATCPTKALYVNRETMEVIFDVSKCIACDACIKICPPRAMKVGFRN